MPWANDPDDRKESNRRYGADWRRKRLACLKAARWRCQIGLEGCTITATEVDHVDQAGNDPGHSNLRAACKSCHAKVTAQQGKGYRKAAAAGAVSRRRSPREHSGDHAARTAGRGSRIARVHRPRPTEPMAAVLPKSGWWGGYQ